ncbi:MAG: phage major capsid protein [Chloroflexi bacterium]|nr:MAG: phage major capsid protein [Chloroflexota bacterium]
MEEILKRLQEVRDEMNKIVSVQQDLYNRARSEGRSLTSDEDEQYQKADADWLALQGEEQRLLDLKSKLERVKEQNPDAAAGQQGNEKRKSYDVVFQRYLRYGHSGLTRDELEVLRSGYVSDGTGKQTRAQTITGSGGGYIIPTEMERQLEIVMSYYGPMWDENVVTKVTTTGGNPLTFPYVDDTSNEGELLAINTSAATQDITFGQVQLDAFKFSSKEVLVPYELIEDEGVGLDATINTILGERLGRVVNNYLTTGTGSSQPNGITVAAAAGATSAAANAITRSDIINLIHSVDPAYRVGPKVGFMFNDAILAAIKKLSIGSSDDRPLWQPSMVVGEPDTLEGHRYWINNHMESSIATTKKTILFGDFSKYLVRKVGSIRLYRLEERHRVEDQTGFIAFLRADADLLVSGAVKVLTQA